MTSRFAAFGATLAAGLPLATGVAAAAPGAPSEMADTRQWVASAFEGKGDGARPCFSFVYDGKPSSGFLSSWKVTRQTRKLDAKRTARTITYADPATGLVVRCEGTEYSDFPAVEWLVNLKNAGKADTPIMESIQVLDAVLPGLGDATVHWSRGGVASFADFEPLEKKFTKDGDTLQLEPGGGRSSNGVLPFFNVAGPQGGTIMAVGWTGEWATEFTSASGGLALKAGMAKTHLLLHPGEEIRTPRILLLFYGGDQWRGQNLLRRFILTHRRPSLNHKPLAPPITWGVFGTTSADVHLANIDQIAEHKLPMDYYWVDAGWYGRTGNWAVDVGSWQIDRKLYPQGFRALSERLAKSGRKLMVWFEPERVHRDSVWATEHSDLLLKLNGADDSLMNLGNPDARKLVTDMVSSSIDEFGLGCYRQDYNIDPLGFWAAHDAPDRQGMTEIRYIEGLYAFWDALLAKHPGLMIDNCASGGRRIDLEMTGRSTPYWRTDGPRDPVAHQCHSYGLMAWVPLSATSQDREGDTYDFRSSMCSSLCINWQHSGDGAWWKFPADFPWDWAKKILDQYVTIRDFYLGDYYPVTPYSQERSVWMGWQLDRPEKGDGMVQAFRREECGVASMTLRLRNLQPDAVYTIRNIDADGTTEMTGRALMETGLPVTIDKQPGAAVITYKRKR